MCHKEGTGPPSPLPPVRQGFTHRASNPVIFEKFLTRMLAW